ncbi:DNA-binding LacI/PurR family transcriptional regulator [Friedmanniella endophytica]|uniref:DNA-binding LacI/PurR family transcriptional regulator n=1 Tax=Microlunatus kandeliicorticis TaxID=1759536 RepID=A0A7W3P7R7_9ACTN|nr:LacI family DNA-binding transcriptional regulator [Microlunatus kandeliicorticis]MBA8796275.1 DNA-binding LacI/PurR family transcriptional regulator [Microlunatus kandeliicorticis]
MADRAGVSVSTVSRALRDSPLVTPETRDRVRAAAEALSFTVSRAASSLATGRLGRVAVVVGGRLGSWFNGAVLDAMYEQVRDAGVELLIYRILDADDRRRFFATLPARRNADALVVASFGLTAAERDRLAGLGMPVVYLNQQVEGTPSVAIDDVAAGALATRHLVSLGHPAPAFVRGDGLGGFDYSAMHRVRGFRAELHAAGLDPDGRVVTAPRNEDGPGIVAALLALDPPPSAVVAESDDLAVTVLTRLRETGHAVPGEVSVIGIDDNAVAARFGLTTVAQPVAALGAEAARMALTLADPGSGASAAADSRVLPVSLVLRSTTRPHRTR